MGFGFRVQQCLIRIKCIFLFKSNYLNNIHYILHSTYTNSKKRSKFRTTVHEYRLIKCFNNYRDIPLNKKKQKRETQS